MDRYRVLFADGSEEKVSADSRRQAEEKAVLHRVEGGAPTGDARTVVSVIRDFRGVRA